MRYRSRLDLEVCGSAPAGGRSHIDGAIADAGNDGALGHAAVELINDGKTFALGQKTKRNGAGNAGVERAGSVVEHQNADCACRCCVGALIGEGDTVAAADESDSAFCVDRCEFISAAVTGIYDPVGAGDGAEVIAGSG